MTVRRLRFWLLVFFCALAVPATALVVQAYSRLKWETVHQYRVLAEELSGRINEALQDIIDIESARSFADYGFLIVAGDPQAGFLQRSPLSDYPVMSAIPGVLGYFQVDVHGTFTTPLLPAAGATSAAYELSAEDEERRRELAGHIRAILSENRLVRDEARSTERFEDALREVKEAELQDLSQISEREPKQIREQAAVRADSPVALAAPADVEAGASGAPEEAEVVAQAEFDKLKTAETARKATASRLNSDQQAINKLGRVEDLKLDDAYDLLQRKEIDAPAAARSPTMYESKAKKRRSRKERSLVPQSAPAFSVDAVSQTSPAPSNLPILTFESELDAFEFSLLDSGHFVLFRNVWRDSQRYVQGALIDPETFVKGVTESAFRNTRLARMSKLIVAFRGDVLSAITGTGVGGYLSNTDELTGSLLYRTRLSSPLSELELIFSVTKLPAGPGALVVGWLAAVLALVLCGGVYLMYRLGKGQIALARQQQDFVSAVSHELNTPLTSIRMYGEMLCEGWASEDKKQSYYEYIFAESERLSRLIANVLQLARMTRNDLPVALKPVGVSEIMDGIRSKISSQVEHAGFGLQIHCTDAAADTVIRVDTDLFAQIIINLVDNAIKFSHDAATKSIDINCTLQRDRTVLCSIRDYGPGVARDQMKKIFKLFYRSENELTRETVGTGIGLALAHQLTVAMRGRIDVMNADPGAEFRISFPIDEQDTGRGPPVGAPVGSDRS
ncbi:MAG: ATP-binding protein [Gammaproteobacteria bacterium]|nr:ATP-binding protein [Gammaproteobacteria bacterium]